MAIPLRVKISTILKLLFEPKVLRFLLSQRHSGYLYENGWFNSFKTNFPVDKNNRPIPWMTYSFINFIEERLNKNLILFEFGAGNSTLYFSKKVKQVLSVEQDINWYKILKKQLPANATITHSKLGEQYENSLSHSNIKFDIIIVDGERRVECIIASLNAISDIGVLILDDSERDEYKKGIELLSNAGFRALNFWGIAPGTFFNKCTTIFYRDKNCFGI